LDALQGDDDHFTPEGLRQIAAADAIVITKQDMAGSRAFDAVLKVLASLNPLAEIVPPGGSDFINWVKRQEMTSNDTDRALHLDSLAATGAQVHGVRSVVIRAAAPASWARFAIWLTRLVVVHGDRILRVKGVLFDPEQGVWLGVHGVRRFFYPPVHLSLQRAPACGACLVFITEDLDPTRIEASYQRLIAAERC
jgi:G3E family GTPase